MGFCRFASPLTCVGRRASRIRSASKRIADIWARTLTLSAKTAAEELRAKYAGRIMLKEEQLSAGPVQKLSLMLKRPELHPGLDVREKAPPVGAPLPAGYHLVYLTPASLEDDLGDDASDIAFTPPGVFKRRMWAGGSLEWSQSNCLCVGDEVVEETVLKSAVTKKNRRGNEMILVEVEKKFNNAKGTALLDRRSFVFQSEDSKETRREEGHVTDDVLELRSKSIVQDSLDDSGYLQRRFQWSPAALFRFSALTYNGHMIHYSDKWCQSIEGFSRPVVHGPLNMINMLDVWRDRYGRDDVLPRSFTYRALAPILAGMPYVIKASQKTMPSSLEASCTISAQTDDMKPRMTGNIVFT